MEKGLFTEQAPGDGSRRCKHELHSATLEQYPKAGMPSLRQSA
jgi:hypothetical protein